MKIETTAQHMDRMEAKIQHLRDEIANLYKFMVRLVDRIERIEKKEKANERF